MLRATASKLMWVGRATVFFVGLCVIVAVVLGVASMAFAANGQPWKLGQANVATAITSLAGAAGVDGPMLQLTNNDSGSDDTALDLNVQSNEPPMDVDSTTKVSQLNADRLDGLSSGAFAAAYERIVVVSPVGTNNAQNGQALLDALASITDASASKPYLLYIEPETYDLGNGSLTMKPFVDIEGSGELNTVITSAATDDNCFPQHPGTVNGSDNAEMRFLTVQNTGTGVCSSAVFNKNDSPRLTHVTVGIRGNGNTISAVWNDNSFPTMTDVTATASGAPSFAYAVFNNGSSPTMTDVTATGSTSSGGGAAYGVFNQEGSSPTIIESALSGTSDALAQTDGGSSRIALSQLRGGVFGGPVQCFNNYNQNMAAVNC